ncbi:MAG: DUF502 domain-containing protein [Proteobacteria bacterium]|nr:DUF502 domain-containing protein [Pseudomonadota bacterium]
MHRIGKAFLLGMATVLPIGVTVYLFYLLTFGAERVMGGLLRNVLPDELYWPGMGVGLAVLVILLIGLLIQMPGLSLLVRLSDAAMKRIPLVKTVYATLQDFMDLLAATRKDSGAASPVRVRLWDEVEMVGLVTDPDYDDDRVLVYLPMSYQLGGYMLALDKSRLTKLDMSVEDALRHVITAGIRRKSGSSGPPSSRN